MSKPSISANAAAAAPIVDDILALIDKVIDMVGEETVTALINERIEIPILTESAEAMLIGYAVKKIHARIHQPTK